MLFNNNDAGDTSAEVPNIIVFINDFTARLGVEGVPLDSARLNAVVRGMHHDFPHSDGEAAASVFKKAANFVCYFISEQPIEGSIPESYSEDLNKIDNSLAGVIAFEIARKMLKGAKIIWTLDGQEHVLEQPIEVSQHSYVDIIDAISGATPHTHFKMMAVLLEQMAYKTNPDCQYPLPDDPPSDGSRQS